jgi:hypothetical protein
VVRIVENWARVQGTVVGVRDVSDPSGFLEVSLELAAIGSVPGTRNMFSQAPGEVIQVLMPASMIESLGVRDGSRVAADIRRADLHRSFVHPERVEVEPDPAGHTATIDAQDGERAVPEAGDQSGDQRGDQRGDQPADSAGPAEATPGRPT